MCAGKEVVELYDTVCVISSATQAKRILVIMLSRAMYELVCFGEEVIRASWLADNDWRSFSIVEGTILS